MTNMSLLKRSPRNGWGAVRSLLILILGISISHLCLADDMVEPTELCNRFVTEPEIQTCRSRIQKLSPDWYLAAICRNQNEHESFWSCIELTKSHTFDPKKIQDCSALELKDQERISCLRQLKPSATASQPKKELRYNKPIPVRSAVREN